MKLSTSNCLTAQELSALAYLESASPVAEMPNEFWEALALLRKRGLVLFRGGHWVALAGPIMEMSQPVASELAHQASA